MFSEKVIKINEENHQLPVDLQELVDESALKHVLVADKKSDDFYSIQKLLKSLVTAVDVNLKQEDCKELLKNFSLFNDECIVYSNIYKLEKELQDFYNKKIRMNNDDICKLCCETIDQSQCSQWFEARRLRLSASSNIHNIKIRTRKTIDKLVNDILYPANVDSESTNYGLSEEDAARKKYEELNDCEVKKTGVIVCEKQPWLCASLDGVVIDDGCVVRLVEIKCPIKCKDKPVVDRENETCNVKYLYFKNGEVELKKNEPYFTQIQVQLYVTGMFTCDLFVYSQLNDGCCTIPVNRDESFLQQAILGAESFYFNHYLPAAYLKFTKENNSNTNGNAELLSQRIFTGVNIINSI